MPGPLIVVIGLGATGSAALCQLARRGVRAVGIERFELGHDRGSSHGATRIIRLAHYENASYVPLLHRAYSLWRDAERLINRKLITITGIAEIGPADGGLVAGTVAAASRFGLPHEVLDARALMRRYAVFRLPDTFVAVVQPDGGYIEAAAALEANIRLAREAGALVQTGQAVIAVEPRHRGVRITTAQSRIDADAAIVAAGPWLGRLLPELRLPLRVTRQAVGWFAPEDAARFAANNFPVFLLESRHGIHYGLPAYENSGVKVARHCPLGEAVDPDGYDRKFGPKDEAAIRAPLAQFVPAANGRLAAAQTCLYTMTPDETFIIDRMPGYPHVVIASPCCGHGFKFSPAIGEILADLVTGGATEHAIAPFRLQRFA
jgi:sarcosine oxidase